jgi:hypothetical protein
MRYTSLNHINTEAILPKYDKSCMVYTPECIQNQNTVIYPYPNGIKKFEILVVDSQLVLKNTIPSPTLVDTFGLMCCPHLTKALTSEEEDALLRLCGTHLQRAVLLVRCCLLRR